MKKLFHLLVAGLLTLLLVAPSLTAFAADADTPPDAQPSAATTLQIDTQHAFFGMACSYAAGYQPQKAGNVLRLVLPLLASGGIKDNAVTARASIDFSAESPFVCKNYEKTVFLCDNAAVGCNPVSCFLVSFDLELAAARKNGNYPISISVNATDQNDTPVQFETVVYAAITDGKKTEEESEPEEPSAAVLTLDTQNAYPDMVCSYAEGYRPLIADNTARLVLPLLASGSIQGNSVNARVEMDFSDGSPFICKNYEKSILQKQNKATNGTNVSGYLVTFDLALQETRQNGNYPVTVYVSGVDKQGQPVTLEATVYVVIDDRESDINALKMQFDELQIPAEVTVSDMIDAPIQAINLSKERVYRVRATLRGDGLLPNGTAYLGDMEPGTAMTAAFSVSVTARSGDSLYGKTDGVVTYTYEDENGTEYSAEQPFSTRIQSPFSEASATAESQDNPKQWWGMMLAVGILLAAAATATLFCYFKRRGR